ncbi:MAG TPA: MerR family transcriptional regulator [Ramlibacter sp.]|nr:MerR family transcriptional regulator [Ramlibacter sp.]
MDYSIGELAKRCGVTVRALHHYEKLGLLRPSGRTGSGYRRYDDRDVHRLHRILAYRQLGVALKDIGAQLAAEGPSLQSVLAQQLAAARQESERLQRVISLIERLMSAQAGMGDVSLADELMELMNAMQTLEQHFTPGELSTLKSIRDEMSAQARDRARIELRELLAAFTAAQQSGVDVRDAQVCGLARRWQALGAPAAQHAALRAKARELIDSAPAFRMASGISPQLKDYIDRAVAAAKPN